MVTEIDVMTKSQQQKERNPADCRQEMLELLSTDSEEKIKHHSNLYSAN